MKKSEFKKLLKPIVKECIRESLLEDGLLSGVISEVVRGLNPKPIVEKQVPKTPPAQSSFTRNLAKEQVEENRKKLMEAISSDSYGGVDIFEGVTPMAGQASPEGQAGSPLGGVSSNDAGLDISGIVGIGGKKWKALMG
jgi:hypothetical protein